MTDVKVKDIEGNRQVSGQVSFGGRTQRSVVLMHGFFTSDMFDELKNKALKEAFVLEGRPSLTSSKASVQKMLKRGIQPTLISDNMAGVLFYKDLVKEIFLSYNETDQEGALCLIGGLILAVLGKKHNIPVTAYPADHNLGISGRSKSSVGIKMLAQQKDLLSFEGTRIAPRGVQAYVPLMEWVPKEYITRLKAHG